MRIRLPALALDVCAISMAAAFVFFVLLAWISLADLMLTLVESL
jgi:hypothetical protein